MARKWLPALLMMLLVISLPGCGVADVRDTTPSADNGGIVEEPVESGNGEPEADYREYQGTGWSFRYPAGWDKVKAENPDAGFVQQSTSGKTLVFQVREVSQAELQDWIQSEIERKLGAEEADNTLAEALTTTRQGELTLYRYTILSHTGDMPDELLYNAVFFDGSRAYELRDAGPVTAEEFAQIVQSFQIQRE